MKYTYNNKKTYKFKRKLKILLTILFAVLISATGYIISRDAYSSPNDNGLVFIVENSRDYTITITASNIPLSGVELYDGSDNLIGTTDNLGEIVYTDNTLPNLDYLIISGNTIQLSYDSPNSYIFTYDISSFEEAYAEFDSSNGQLRIFRDVAGLYTNGQTSGTKTYYAGIEEVTGTNTPKWSSIRSSITSVVIEDIFKPKTATSMFMGSSNLTSITGMENLDTSEATYMNYMFYNCSSLTSIDLSNFDTSSALNMLMMFSGCSSLTRLDLTNFNTNNVSNMSNMFAGCTNLIYLDISTLRILSGNSQSTNMFSNTTSLRTLKLGVNNTFRGVEGLSGSWQRSGSNTVYTATDLLENYNGSTMAGTYNLVISGEAYAEFDSSNGKLRIFRDTAGLYTNGQVVGTKTYYTGIETITGSNRPKWKDIAENIQTVVIEDVFRPKTAYYMFNDCENLNSITGIENLDTSEATYMTYMFNGCSSLASIDLSNFDTSSAVNMLMMFANCDSLRKLDLSNFNTSSVINMSNMFSGCTNLAYLDISSLRIPNGNAQSTNMFSNTASLRILKLGVNNAFRGVEGLSGNWKRDGNNTVYTATDLLENYNGSTMAGTYQRIELTPYAIVYEDGDMVFQAGNTPDPNKGNVLGIYTGFETGTYTDETIPWASVRESITEVYFDTTIIPISTAYWFYGMEDLGGIYYTEYLYTGDVTDMSDMFYGCTQLTYLGLDTFDTSNVLDMSDMFNNCYNLSSLDISGFDTANVIYMVNMFNSCSSLTSLDVSGFDTSNVVDMSDMFLGCSSLTSLDVTNFNTSNVTNMQGMFSWCAIIALDLSNFDTSNVESMSSMFYGCSNLTTLDVSNFDTSNVENMANMFMDCSSLTSLDLSGFDTSSVTNMDWMFSGCSSLTTLDVSSFDTSNVVYMQGMFDNCSSLTSLNVSNFDTSNVVSMAYMFNNCRSLTELDISNFDTSSLSMDYSYSIKDMFAYMLSLNTLKLGTEWEFLPSNGLTKSWIRDGDTTVYTAAQLTSSYDGSTMAGTYRAMVQLTITEEVRGSLADINKNFSFTINVIKNGHGINSTQSYTGTRSGSLHFNNGTATFSLKHGENITIVLPCNVDYTVTQNSDGYTVTKTNDSGNLNDNATSEFIDTLNGTTPTGIFFDLIPFIIIITFGVFGIFLIRKFKYI